MPNPYAGINDWAAARWDQAMVGRDPTTGQSSANPNDPNQQANWAVGIGQANANRSLYDPETLKQLQSIFGPYFSQQRQNLTGQMNTDRATAGRQAGAFAASQGFANPGQFSSGVGQRVTSAYAPQFGQLEQSQLGQLLNAGAASSQFSSQQQQALMNSMFQRAQIAQQQQQYNDQPGIGSWLLGGLGAAAGSILGPVGTAIGGSLASSLFPPPPKK